jgi:hypothetical protein
VSAGTSAPRVTVQLRVDGGFAAVPGLAGPFELDTDRLDPAAADTLRELLAETGFFTRPDRFPPPAPGAADTRTYTITATAEGRTNTVRVADPIADPGVARLVRTLLATR